MTDITNFPLPRENTHLFGHRNLEILLAEACGTGCLHHSLIFGGKQGIGKTTLAYRLARFLLKSDDESALFDSIEEGLGISPECSVFRQIASGAHPSVKLVERSKNPNTGKIVRDITVGDIRTISEFFRMTSVGGNWRIVIIDSADDMNENAANALLKLLEEPPLRSLIILISHIPGTLLPTIRSRCQFMRINSLSSDDISRALMHYEVNIPSSYDLELLTDLSDGSLGEAIRLLQLNGLSLYNEIINLISKPYDLGVDLDTFSDRIAKSDSEEIFELYLTLMERAVCMKVFNLVNYDNTLCYGDELEQYINVWGKIRTLFTKTNRLGLDRKQVILNAFLYASEVPERMVAR